VADKVDLIACWELDIVFKSVIVIMFLSRVAFLLLVLLSSGSCTFPNDSSGPEKRHSAQSNVEEKTTIQHSWYSQLFYHDSNQQKEQKLVHNGFPASLNRVGLLDVEV
jgi:hypothetical protein